MSVVEASGTESAARVVDVLLLFTEAPHALGVSEIARRLGLSKAVVHRILQTLLGRKLLVACTDTRGYRLGPSAAALGARALRDSDLRAAGVPMIRELQRQTDETTTLSALVPGGRVYLDQVESRKEIKMTVEIGRRFPLHAGSSGKCMLAFFDEHRREEILASDLTAVTERTVVDANELRAELAEIRHRGYAWSQGERQLGAGSVAAPVFTVDGEVVGALSVCGPADRVDQAARQRFAPLVLAASDDISRALGWRGGLPDTVAS